MNYLAHAYLSFNDPLILTGNMISDHVKGRKMYDFESRIVDGIKLHRRIDEFTDNHTCTKTIRSFFSKKYRLYSAVFSDIVCDYFLANEPKIFNYQHSLRMFTTSCYHHLDALEAIMPESFKAIYPSMKHHDWLYNYQFDFGIEKSFAGLVKRAKYIDDSATAFEIFKTNKEDMRIAFEQFFPELFAFAANTLHQLVNND